jgi:hypothetical protein
MKTIAKVLESMLSKPATPTWSASAPTTVATLRSYVGPTQAWTWPGGG